MITAFVLIDADSNQIAELAPLLADVEGVREAHSVAAADADLVAVLSVPTHEAIATVVTEHIAKLPGILSTRTMIAFRSYSDAQTDASFEGFGD